MCGKQVCCEVHLLFKLEVRAMFDILLKFLLIIWELPQNLLGSLLLAFYKASSVSIVKMHGYPERIVYFSDYMPTGISLGGIIIVNSRSGGATSKSVAHEYGHTIQSMYLGPLYLIVIGLPSLLWNMRCRGNLELDYYSFFTERWADKLGKVKR